MKKANDILKHKEKVSFWLNMVKAEGNTGYHVFHTLMERFKNRLTVEEIMDMQYVFMVSERHVAENNEGHTYITEFYFNKLTYYSKKVEFNPLVKFGMKSVCYSSLALRFFNVLNYTDALKHLNKSLFYCYKQAKSGDVEFLSAISNIWINRARIFLRTSNTDAFQREMIRFFRLYLLGWHSNSMVSSYFNSVGSNYKHRSFRFGCSYFFRRNSDSDLVIEPAISISILNAILCSKKIVSFDGNSYNALLSVKYYLEREYTLFIETIEEISDNALLPKEIVHTIRKGIHDIENELFHYHK